MALSLLTPWISDAPLNLDKARARLRGGQYDDVMVDAFLASLVRHASITGMATAALCAQVCRETANFRYGGQVKPEQFNFAGIAATNDGAAGHSFGSIDAGVRGLIAHHGNYLFGALDNWPPAWEPYKPFAIRNAQVLALTIAGVKIAGTVRKIGDFRNGVWAWTPTVPMGSLDNGYARGIVEIGNELLGGASVAVSKPTVNTKHPSPNRGYPSGVHRVDAVIWHITQGSNSLGWLTNPASGASSNYLIARDGAIYELVPPTESAWANGRVCNPDADHNQPLIAKWIKEGVNFNRRTVSIEHEGMSSLGKGGSLTTAQIEATVKLTAWLCQAFNLTPDKQHIFGHFEIDACDRPNCPGFSPAEWSDWVGRVAGMLAGTPPSAMIEPVVTERQDWGGKGRLISEEVTVVNDTTGQYFSRKKEWAADGVKVGEWRTV